MNLGSCHAPAWVPSKSPPNSAWAAARRIRGQLCRLCDLALEAKDCGRLSRFRYQELKILRALHGDFERLDLDTAHCISATECDVCRLARAAKRMALSVYACDYTDFLHATRDTPDGMTSRASRNFGDDFRRYIARSGLPEHSKTYQLMSRAELVSQYLAATERTIEISPGAEERAAKNEAVGGLQPPEYGSLNDAVGKLKSLHVRIMTLGMPQLRIVR